MIVLFLLTCADNREYSLKLNYFYMFGKIFESLYEGSMVGSGSDVFAVWGYVIAKMKPDVEMGAQVDLNPQLLAFILGEKPDVIQKVIDKLCAPDTESRTPDEEGKRLVRVGQFTYRVVNGAKYMALRDEEDRRRSNRLAKRRQRAQDAAPEDDTKF